MIYVFDENLQTDFQSNHDLEPVSHLNAQKLFVRGAERKSEEKKKQFRRKINQSKQLKVPLIEVYLTKRREKKKVFVSSGHKTTVRHLQCTTYK